MAKKKADDTLKPKDHPFCFKSDCKSYVDRSIGNNLTIKVCNYLGHCTSLGCLGSCPKNNI